MERNQSLLQRNSQKLDELSLIVSKINEKNDPKNQLQETQDESGQKKDTTEERKENGKEPNINILIKEKKSKEFSKKGQVSTRSYHKLLRINRKMAFV